MYDLEGTGSTFGPVRGLTADQHRADGEELLGEGVRRNVAESHGGQAAASEVQRCDVALGVRDVLHGYLEPFGQGVYPTWNTSIIQFRGSCACGVHSQYSCAKYVVFGARNSPSLSLKRAVLTATRSAIHHGMLSWHTFRNNYTAIIFAGKSSR